MAQLEMLWVDILSMADMGPMHGFASCLSGCLIFNRETDCSLMGLTVVETPFGGMLAAGGALARSGFAQGRVDGHWE